MRKMNTITLLVWAVLALVLAAAVRGEGDGEDGSPVIGVDAEGNLHINTTSSNTTVYVNGQDMKQMMEALMLQQAAQAAEVRELQCKLKPLLTPTNIITTRAVEPTSVFAADLDGDGDIDVLSASADDDKIAWYENIFGNGTFSQQKVIATNADGARSVFAADLDGDGDMDVLSASILDDKIAWYENEDGLGTFSQQKVITASPDTPNSVMAADLDGDGDMDVLSASINDDKIAWYENEDGLGSFSAENVITTNSDGARSVFAADLDGDGDMDVLSASHLGDKVAWYENEDGLGSFSAENVITTSARGAYSVFAADLDGDGDMDVLSASYYDAKIAWYENEDGLGSFSAENVITTITSAAFSVFAADMDGDGDMDVLTGSSLGATWSENEDGLGTFSSQKVVTAFSSVRSVFAADLDGDGDMEVLSAISSSNIIAWFEVFCNPI